MIFEPMIRFQHPEALYLFLVLLPLGGMFAWFLWGRKQALARLGEGSLVARLTPEKPTSKHTLKFVLVALAWSSLVLALANPQMGRKTEEVTREGVDLFVAIDISTSMLAEDVPPNRLARTKQFLGQLVDRLGGDRVGLIVFAGYPYLQMPMTTDYASTRSILRTINTDLAGTQGTDIGAAIEMAQLSFERAKSEHRVLLIISDGEDHEQEALDAAREAAQGGMAIFTVGVGSSQGSPVPDLRSGQQVGFKKDNSGSIVLSKLNQEMLRDVAEAGAGQYFHLSKGNNPVAAVRNALAALEKEQYETQQFADFEDQYQWFLVAGLLLLVVEFLLSERRVRLLSRVKFLQ